MLVCDRSVDVSPMLDPAQLAQQAVDLNLRLMRWRAAPDLNLPVLARTKCLLLGEQRRREVSRVLNGFAAVISELSARLSN